MSELLYLVLRAHGGLDRWNNFNKVSAQFVAGGGLLPMKGLEADPNPLDGTVTIHEESTVIRPFGQPDWRMIFTPNRRPFDSSLVAIRSAKEISIRRRRLSDQAILFRQPASGCSSCGGLGLLAAREPSVA
jgi:hypothetical protein